MSRHTYPRKMWPQNRVADKYMVKRGTKCDLCGEAFEVGDKIVVQETQNSCFRGDDDAEFYHADCHSAWQTAEG